MIWFGGLYQKPIISDYEEVTRCVVSLWSDFFIFLDYKDT